MIRIKPAFMYQKFNAKNNFSRKEKDRSRNVDSVNSEDYSDNLRIYYNELSKIPTLTADEERLLIQNNLTKDGILNEYAKRRLLEGNLKFVFTVASKYRGSGISLEEIIEQGNLGLVKAMDKFDYKKGFRFYCYAVWWIKSYISQYIKDEKKISSIYDSYCDNTGGEKDDSDCSYMDSDNETDLWSDVESSDSFEFRESDFSDDNDDEDDTEESMTSNDCELYMERKELNSAKNDFFKKISDVLSDEELLVIKHNFGIGTEKMSVKKISELLGLKAQKIKRIKDNAMKKMRFIAKDNAVLAETYA